MNVCLILRKKNIRFFSIENVFLALEPYINALAKVEKAYVPFETTGLYAAFRNLLFVRSLRADVFHISGDVHYVVRALPARKTILTIHDCVFLERPPGIRRSVLKWLFLDMPVKRASHITTISEKTKDDVVRFTNCDPGKIVVIPNAVGEHIYFTPKDFQFNCPKILFIGTTKNKNLERSAVALQGLSCHLRIIGVLSDGQQELLSTLSITYSSASGLTDQQMATEYASCDIVLFPSTYEGFGLPIIEGQKAGRVVITSDLSPIKEVAGDGAWLVDPSSESSITTALRNVIQQPDLRSRLITKGFLNVERFTAANIANQYHAIYNAVLLTNAN